MPTDRFRQDENALRNEFRMPLRGVNSQCDIQTVQHAHAGLLSLVLEAYCPSNSFQPAPWGTAVNARRCPHLVFLTHVTFVYQTPLEPASSSNHKPATGPNGWKAASTKPEQLLSWKLAHVHKGGEPLYVELFGVHRRLEGGTKR